jgi:hypothetical protein
MISIIRRFMPCVLITSLLCFPAMAQQILDEMQLIDISREAAIRSTVIRDPELALLVIKTQISALRIQSNNIIKKSEQVEPGTWHIRLVPGTHRLSFQAEGFISVQERYYFNPKDVKGVQIRVIPAAEKKEEKNVGIIVIKSTPDSAAVYLNDQFYGTTPYLGKTLAGQYKLELKKDPYLTHEELIIIVSGETLPVNVELGKSLGSVTVSSKPENARVEINDRYIGETPLEFKKIGKGRHTLKVSIKNHETFESTFEINRADQTEKFNITLKPMESQLSIQGTPSNAQVFINGNTAGLLPLQNKKILYGLYDISVRKTGYFSYEKSVLIDKSEPFLLSVGLKPKSKYSALLYSTLLPGSGQIYSGRSTMGIIVGSAAIGSAIATLLFNSNYDDKKDIYMAHKTAYDTNTDLGKMASLYKTSQDSYTEMEDAQSISNIVFGITAVIWLYNMADALFFFPDLSKIDLQAETQANGSKLILNFKF